MIIRAVIDANVFASALINPNGPPGQIVRNFLVDKSFTLIGSSAIFEEVRRCLSYPKVRKLISGSDAEIETMCQLLEVESEIIEASGYEQSSYPLSLSDSDDFKYILTALEGKANYIVSGDSDLLTLKEYEGIKILKPRIFLELI